MRKLGTWGMIGVVVLSALPVGNRGPAWQSVHLVAAAQQGPVTAPQPMRDGDGSVSSDAWMGLAGAIVGAVIGFAAAVFAVALASRDANRRHRRAVEVARQTIVGEVTVNQDNFKADWYWVRDSPHPADVAPVNRAGMYPAPTVITSAWDSQIGIVPDAFSAGDALDLHRFYASAHTAVAVRATIQSLYLNDTAQQSRNEAFDIYKLHANRVMEYAVPQASGGDRGPTGTPSRWRLVRRWTAPGTRRANPPPHG